MTKKAQIFNHLQNRFGTKPFRYTDIVIAALMVNGFIKDPSEYTTENRGYYATNITAYSSDYLYNPSKGDPRYLVRTYEHPIRKSYYTLGGQE